MYFYIYIYIYIYIFMNKLTCMHAYVYIYTIQDLPKPEHEGGPPASPLYRTFTTPLGCITVRVIDGFGGYEKIGGTGARVWEASLPLCECVCAGGSGMFGGKRVVELGTGDFVYIRVCVCVCVCM